PGDRGVGPDARGHPGQLPGGARARGGPPQRRRRRGLRAHRAARGARSRWGGCERYALFVGRISEQKGIFQLLDAARQLPEGVQLVLCASSPDTPELLTRLQTAVSGRPQIRWINAMLPLEEIVQIYSRAAVFVCPSIYEP